MKGRMNPGSDGGREKVKGPVFNQSSREVKPERMAYLVRSAMLWRSSFSIMCWRYVSMVLTLTIRCEAISLVEFPSAKS